MAWAGAPPAPPEPGRFPASGVTGGRFPQIGAAPFLTSEGWGVPPELEPPRADR